MTGRAGARRRAIRLGTLASGWAVPHLRWAALLRATGDTAGAATREAEAAARDREDPATPGRYPRAH